MHDAWCIVYNAWCKIDFARCKMHASSWPPLKLWQIFWSIKVAFPLFSMYYLLSIIYPHIIIYLHYCLCIVYPRKIATNFSGVLKWIIHFFLLMFNQYLSICILPHYTAYSRKMDNIRISVYLYQNIYTMHIFIYETILFTIFMLNSTHPVIL